MRWQFSIILAMSTFLVTLASGEVRTWIDKNGQRLSAEYVGFNNGSVVLKQGIRKYRVPLSTLSDEDQKYVQQKVTEAAKDAPATPNETTQPTGSKATTDPELLELLASIPKPSPVLSIKAERRTWTDNQRRQVTAKFVRVNEEGHVVLELSTAKLQVFPMNTFVRPDIEYIRALLEADSEVRLANAERQAIIDQITVPIPLQFDAMTWREWTDKNGNRIVASLNRVDERQNVYLALENRVTRNFQLSDFSPADLQYIRDEIVLGPDEKAIVDAIPRPSPDFFEQPEMRVWTDRVGNQRTARMSRVDMNGKIIFYYENRSQGGIDLAALSHKDLEYVRDYLENDGPAVIFPPGEFQPLTSTQEDDGERTWTDRKGVKLNGKLKERKGELVYFESGGKTLSFPYLGLSGNDQRLVSEEMNRRARERRASSAVASSSSSPSYPSQGYGSSNSNYGAGSYPDYGSSSGNSDYGSGGYTDYGSGSSSNYGSGGSGLTYEFHCPKCNASWTDNTPISSHSCASSGSSRSSGLSGSSRSRGSTSTSGSAMTAYGAGKVVGGVLMVVLLVGGLGFAVKLLAG